MKKEIYSKCSQEYRNNEQKLGTMSLNDGRLPFPFSVAL